MRARGARALLAAGALALAAVGCGDDTGGNGDPVEVTEDGGGDDIEGAEEQHGAEDGSGSVATGCDGIPQATLDLVAPGLEPDEVEVPGDLAALACAWDSEHLFLQLMRYDGTQFWPGELYEDSDKTEIDLCDEAFMVEDFGLDLNVLDGDRVWMVGATQAGAPQDQRLSVEEGVDRLVGFAEAVIDC